MRSEHGRKGTGGAGAVFSGALVVIHPASRRKMFGAFPWLALAVALVSTGCATITESGRIEDLPIRSYSERTKVARWTYRVADVGPSVAESADSGEGVAVSLAVTRYHACETRLHNVVDRTKVTHREWNPSAANSRTSLYFWGAVGVAASVAGGAYLLSQAHSSGDTAGAVALMGGGSLAFAAMPVGNELRALDSTEHVGPVDEVKTKKPGECDAEPVRDTQIRLRESSAQAVVVEITTDAEGRGEARVPAQAILAGGPQLAIEVAGHDAGTTTALAPVYEALVASGREARRAAERRQAHEIEVAEAARTRAAFQAEIRFRAVLRRAPCEARRRTCVRNQPV